MGDAWMGDDFFHQGAFRQSYGLEYAWAMEASDDWSKTPNVSRYDTYEWYLLYPNLRAMAAAVGADAWPTWRNFVAHPSYDAFWQRHALDDLRDHARRPHPDGGRLVGPGGRVRRDRQLRRARAARFAPPELPGDGPVEPRPVARATRPRRWARCSSAAPPAPISGRTSRGRGSTTGSREQATGSFPRRRCSTPGPTSGGASAPGRRRRRRPPRCTSMPTDSCASRRPPSASRVRPVRVRSGAPGALSVPAGGAHVRSARIALADLGGRGPALRGRSLRRPVVGNRRRSPRTSSSRAMSRRGSSPRRRAATPTGWSS